MKSRIGVVGLWHLGCTVSACWSEMGYPVIGYDENGRTVESLRSGRVPIYEPRLEHALRKNIRKNRLQFETEIGALRDCEFVFLTYDTPVLENDESDLGPLERAIEKLSRVLRDRAVVIVSSQTPVGTCRKFREILQGRNRTLELVYSPENLRLGEAIQSYMSPGRIILGAESSFAEKRVRQLLKNIRAEILTMNLSSAEMVKHGINSFLALSITFVNQLSDLCETSGADILSVVRGLKSEPRIGERAYLLPGIGFSGGTLGRDLKALGKINPSAGTGTDLFAAIYDLNFRRKNVVLDKILRLSGDSADQKKIGVLGLTYKPGTSTLRRSLPVEMVQEMLKKGARVSVFDPKADYGEWPGECAAERAVSVEELVSQSELIVILTEWPEFRLAQWKKYLRKENPQTVLDTKNFLADLNLKKMGYQYFGIGRNS